MRADADLIKSCLSGRAYERNDAATELFERYTRFVSAIIRRVAAGFDCWEEAQQEVWLTVFRRLGSFDRHRSLRPWLAEITVRTTRGIVRRCVRRCREKNEADELDPIDERYADEIERLLARDEFEQLVARSSSPLSECLVVLRETHGNKHDAAARLGCSVRTIQTRMHKLAASLNLDSKFRANR